MFIFAVTLISIETVRNFVLTTNYKVLMISQLHHMQPVTSYIALRQAVN